MKDGPFTKVNCFMTGVIESSKLTSKANELSSTIISVWIVEGWGVAQNSIAYNSEIKLA